MNRELEEEVKRMCERERVVAAARTRAMSLLLTYLQRLRDPLAYEVQRDHDEEETTDENQ
jgi:hypothetical protein